MGSFQGVFTQTKLDKTISNIESRDFASGEHKIGLEELHGSLTLVWKSLSLVWADIFLICFSVFKNSSKTHFCPKIKETQFSPQFVLGFLLWTHFIDNSIEPKELHL